MNVAPSSRGLGHEVFSLVTPVRIRVGSLKNRLSIFECKHLKLNMRWYMYIVRCADDSLYTGITNGLQRRILEHNTNSRLGAKSLRRKRPVVLAYYELFATQNEAAKRERSIKRWTRKYKLKLIEGFTGLP